MATYTCRTHRALERKAEDYWKTFSGLMRRIDSLAQDFNFKVVNNAVKIIAPVNEAKWIRWVSAGDDRVCPICQGYAEGGRSGFYHVTWFQPDNPHDDCRCEREILFYNPFE